MTIPDRVLAKIREAGPISARDLATRLSLNEKQARSGIDRLRQKGVPIWNDRDAGTFWWSDAYPTGEGWTRAWPR